MRIPITHYTCSINRVCCAMVFHVTILEMNVVCPTPPYTPKPSNYNVRASVPPVHVHTYSVAHASVCALYDNNKIIIVSQLNYECHIKIYRRMYAQKRTTENQTLVEYKLKTMCRQTNGLVYVIQPHSPSMYITFHSNKNFSHHKYACILWANLRTFISARALHPVQHRYRYKGTEFQTSAIRSMCV